MNVGDAHLQTLEATADWAPVAGLHATGAVAVTHNRVSGSIAQLTDADNRRLPETPELAARAGLAYEWNRSGAPVWRVAGAADYTGPSVLGVGDALDVRQGGYANGEASLAARWPAVDLSLRLENLTNTRGNRFAYGNPFLLAYRRQVTPLRPFSVTLAAAYHW